MLTAATRLTSKPVETNTEDDALEADLAEVLAEAEAEVEVEVEARAEDPDDPDLEDPEAAKAVALAAPEDEPVVVVAAVEALPLWYPSREAGKRSEDW